jgi:hypothetical protein
MNNEALQEIMKETKCSEEQARSLLGRIAPIMVKDEVEKNALHIYYDFLKNIDVREVKSKEGQFLGFTQQFDILSNEKISLFHKGTPPDYSHLKGKRVPFLISSAKLGFSNQIEYKGSPITMPEVLQRLDLNHLELPNLLKENSNNNNPEFKKPSISLPKIKS